MRKATFYDFTLYNAFLNTSGGLIALFNGMSILSIFEMIVWLLKIPAVLKKDVDKKIKVNSGGDDKAITGFT